uniref:Uncharacterized protein n=1 Tax=Strigops habroptila TaxID=2489341 RepID=A0A672UUS0_STRHB
MATPGTLSAHPMHPACPYGHPTHPECPPHVPCVSLWPPNTPCVSLCPPHAPCKPTPCTLVVHVPTPHTLSAHPMHPVCPYAHPMHPVSPPHAPWLPMCPPHAPCASNPAHPVFPYVHSMPLPQPPWAPLCPPHTPCPCTPYILGVPISLFLPTPGTPGSTPCIPCVHLFPHPQPCLSPLQQARLHGAGGAAPRLHHLPTGAGAADGFQGEWVGGDTGLPRAPRHVPAGSQGVYLSFQLTMKEYLITLFDNRTWGLLVPNASSLADPPSKDPWGLWQEWCHPSATIFGTLAFFLMMKFWMLILATTLPLPAGYFMPIFVYGAAIGRLLGETVALLFPEGIRSEGALHPVVPGGYALAGAAAFSGSVTHSISTALLVCEATGHLSHVLPVILAVLVANAITQKHQPSFYDGTIIVKKLPYLPRIRSRHMASYQVVVEEFMERRVVALAKGSGFEEVLAALDTSADAEYPVLESAGSPTLVGTVSRAQLVTFLQSHKHPQAPKEEKLPAAGTLGDNCAIEPIMLQLSPWTSLHQAHHLFELLRLQRIFVTRFGELVGAVSRAELRRAIEELANPK